METNREQHPSANQLAVQPTAFSDWINATVQMDSQYPSIFEGEEDNVMMKLTKRSHLGSSGMQREMEAPQKASQTEKGLVEKRTEPQHGEATFALQNPDIVLQAETEDRESNRLQVDCLLKEETPKAKKKSWVKKFRNFLTLECVKENKLEPLYKQEDKPMQPTENNGAKWNLVRGWRKDSRLANRLSKSDTDAKTQLFGQPLCKLCQEDCSLPKPITKMLVLLRKNVLSTEGVFRMPCGNKHMMDIKEQLNSGLEVDLEGLPLNLLVWLLKHFLMELPDSLLVTELCDDWMRALDTEDPQQRAEEITKVADKLPQTNRLLLQQLMSVLHLIAESRDITKMNAPHLAVCIGPVLLRLDNTPLNELGEKISKVTKLTHFLIEHCEILGENTWNLLDTDEDNAHTLSSQQQDSA